MGLAGGIRDNFRRARKSYQKPSKIGPGLGDLAAAHLGLQGPALGSLGQAAGPSRSALAPVSHEQLCSWRTRPLST